MGKSIIIKFLAAMFCFVAMATAQTVWDGTANQSWFTSNEQASVYEIATAEQLRGLAVLVNNGQTFNGRTIRLTDDIALNDTTANGGWQNWGNNGVGLRQWQPIGQFQGTFDGNGKVISGLYINTDLYDAVGLFGLGHSYGSISNLGLVGFYVRGDNPSGNAVGGIVGIAETNIGGWLSQISITNSYAIGNVVNAGPGGSIHSTYRGAVGGISGFGGNIRNSYFKGSVTGTSINNAQVGGIIGAGRGGSVRNSYFIGSVTGTSINAFVGGLIGSGSSIENSYFIGNITGNSENVGGLTGSGGNIINSFYNSDAAVGGTVLIRQDTPKTREEMKGTALFDLLQIRAGTRNNVEGSNFLGWVYNVNDFPTLLGTNAVLDTASYFERGSGSSVNPFIIQNKYQLVNLSALVRSGNNFNTIHFRLGADIALNDTTLNSGWQNWGNNGAGLQQWQPIGREGTSFSGNFDGNGRVISGLYINSDSSGALGLFGNAHSSGSINNLALVGFFVRGFNAESNQVGGIVGIAQSQSGNFSSSISITDSYAVGNVVNASFGGSVHNSWPTALGAVGGISGLGGNIRNSYFKGSVTGTSVNNAQVGGIIGLASHSGSVMNSYFAGNVTGTSINAVVGGLIGNGGINVENSYFIGNITGNSENVGGLTGSGGNMINSFYNSDAAVGATILRRQDIAKTREEMKGTAFFNLLQIRAGTRNNVSASYNFHGWVFNEGDFPTLSGTNAVLDTASYFESGYGIAARPYIIMNAYQLTNLSALVRSGNSFQNTHFRLGNDIELNDTTLNGGWRNWENNGNGLRQWDPIGRGISFSGHFDGDGKIISGLYINSDSNVTLGLFGNTHSSGSISNLGLVGFLVRGSSALGNTVGSIVGNASTQSGNFSSTITNSYAVGNVVNAVSGIIGGISGVGGNISNSYFQGSVIGNGSTTSTGVGGIIGWASHTGSVTNSYFVGNITGYGANVNIGGLIGNGGTITNSFYNADAAVGETVLRTQNTALPQAEMQNFLTYLNADWDFNTIWTIPHNSTPIFQNQVQNGRDINTVAYTIQNQHLTSTGNPTTIQLHTGNPITPTITGVSFEEENLTLNTDYYVLYRNNTNIGNTAEIVLVGSGDFVGVKYIPFHITAPRDFSSVSINPISEQVATGSPITPEPIIWDFGGTVRLRSGTDFMFGHSNNTNEGTAAINIIGWGDIYDGADTSVSFQIVDAKNIEGKSTLAIANPQTWIFTGMPITPAVTVTHADDGVLELDKDFTVTYSNNINAGTATISVTGIGDYKGTLTNTFAISPKALEQSMILPIPDQEFAGGDPVIPVISLFHGDKLLEEDRDFTFGTAVGNTTITDNAIILIRSVAGGNYTGNISAQFRIVSSVPKTDIEVIWESNRTFTYTGEPQAPTATAFLEDGTPVLLRVTGAQTDAREAAYTATAALVVANPALRLTPNTADFRINRAQIRPTLQISDIQTGETLAPRVIGNSGNGTVSYLYSTRRDGGFEATAPTAEGIYFAKATITETDNYSSGETDVVLFAITRAEVTTITVNWGSQTEFVFNGMQQAPTATATLGDKTFDLTIIGATDTGSHIATARLAIPDVEYRLANATLNFRITQKPLSANAIDPIGNFHFAGLPINPSITVRDENLGVLIENVDYTVEYGDNILGLGSVKVTGIGNYSGTAERFFVISFPTARVVNVIWEGETSFDFDGNEHSPTATASEDGIELEILGGERTNVGNYTAVATLKNHDPHIILANSVMPFSIEPKELEVVWDENRTFTFNRMVQFPNATVKDGNTEIPLTVLNIHSAAGTYTGASAPLAVITNEVQRRNYTLTNNTVDYTILRRPLRVVVPDTIALTAAIVGDTNALQTHIRGIMSFDGFARDTLLRQTDDENVLSGEPTVKIEFQETVYRPASASAPDLRQRSIELIRYRIYLLTIQTEEMTADNYNIQNGIMIAEVPGERVTACPICGEHPCNCPNTIRRHQPDDRFGIVLENAVVSDFARISVITPEPATANIRILDNLGNVVFSANGVGAYCIRPAMPNERTTMNNVGDLGVCKTKFREAERNNTPLQNAIIWNLTNQSGRFVANGTYLIIVEATGISDKRYLYSTRIGVNR